MAERNTSTAEDVARLSLATIDTFMITGAIKVATLKPEGVSNLLDAIINDQSTRLSHLVRFIETGLSEPLILGMTGGFFAISLVEQLKSLNFFQVINEPIRRSRNVNPLSELNYALTSNIQEIFQDPSKQVSNRGSQRFNRKNALITGVSAYATGVISTFAWSLPFVAMGADPEIVRSVALTVGSGIGTACGFYISRYFGYYSKPSQ